MFKLRMKYRLALTLFLTGCFWIPLTILFCYMHPVKTAIYAGKIGVVKYRVDKRVKSALRPITRPFKAIGDKYGVTDSRNIQYEIVTPWKRSPIPQPSMFTKVSRRTWKIITFWVKRG